MPDKPSPSRSQVGQFDRLAHLISFHIAGITTSVFLGHLLCFEALLFDDTLVDLRITVSCVFCVFSVPMTRITVVTINPQIKMITVIELNEQNHSCFFCKRASGSVLNYF